MERIAFRPVRARQPGDAADHVVRPQLPAPERRRADLGLAAADDRLRIGPHQSFVVGSIAIPKLDVVIIGVTLALLGRPRPVPAAHDARQQMRAAAEDFRMARVLGVRADTRHRRRIRALRGCSPASASILLTAQTGTVSPTIGVERRAVRVHRDDHRRDGQPARRGRRRLLDRRPDGRAPGRAAARARPYRDAFVFAAVLVVLVVRPQGLIPARAVGARDPRRAACATCFPGPRRRRPARRHSMPCARQRRRSREAVLSGDALAAPRR